MQTIAYKTFRLNRRFGIEIELGNSISKHLVIKAVEDYSNYKIRSNNRKSINNKIWHVKIDGTCGTEDDCSDGWEVASFVGRIPEDINHMGGVANALKEIGAKVNSNCGLHIHAEVLDFTPQQMGILLAHWLKFEHILKEIISPTRNTDYCTPLDYVMLSDIGDCYRLLKFTPFELYSCFLPPDALDPYEIRYRALNIINYVLCLNDRRRKRKTIELRLPESTLEEEDVIGWTRLFLNFVEHVKTAPMPENLYMEDLETSMKLLGLSHTNSKFFIFGATLTKTRFWLLNKIMRRATSQRLKNQAKKILKSIKM